MLMRQAVQFCETQAQRDLHPEEDSLQDFILYFIKAGVTACIVNVLLQFSAAAKILSKVEGPQIIFRAFWEILKYKA